uniref:Uncharacterized protein n=1 Tax=Ciona savignyi TaxID=51511 RepID=H2Y6K7_CIOSA
MFVTFILCMSKNKMHYHHNDQQRQYYRSKSKINSRNREKQLDYSRDTLQRKKHISQVLEPMTQNPEPRWMTYLKGQQFVKKRLKAKLNATKVWKNNRPSADCNVIGFLNGSALNPNSIYNRRVALGSFPGSGNTWLRHLFHVTTGVWTGSLYFDKKLCKGGFLGEVSDCFDPSVFGIKVHDKLHADVMKCHFDVIVLVLRNPYHSILSEFNRRQGLSHVALASEEAFHDPDWERYASMKTKSF